MDQIRSSAESSPGHQPSPASHVTVHPETLYVGTPAYLISTTNPTGTPNLAAASSYWALGDSLVLGIESDGQTIRNLREEGELTVNFPSPRSWRAVLRLAYLTGRWPVPDTKKARYRYEPDKFGAAALTPQPSHEVRPPRVLECDLQFEARVTRMTSALSGDYCIVEAEVVRVHAAPEILVRGTDLVDPTRWEPLVYSFRHFFRRGEEVGWLPSSPTAPRSDERESIDAREE